eukprot:gene4262-4514_t
MDLPWSKAQQAGTKVALALDHLTNMSTTEQAATQHTNGLEAQAHSSSSTSTGYALNGGKVSAKASAHAGIGLTAAESNATAVADRASLSLATSKSHANNLAAHGVGISRSSATSVADRSSAAISDAQSLSVGMGGQSSISQVTSNSAATNSGASMVGGTAVSSAGPGSTSLTTSNGTGAAQDKAVAHTRADSISVGVLGSNAHGTAAANSKASKSGLASSQSLMESFAVNSNSNTNASSIAQSSASELGASWTRDKAVAIGLKNSSAVTNTASKGDAGNLGLSVIDSVVRLILLKPKQESCAAAVNNAYSDVAQGPSVSLDTFILQLRQRADAQCVTSFKNIFGWQVQRVPGGTIPLALAAHAGTLPSFDAIDAQLAARLSPTMQTVSAAIADKTNLVRVQQGVQA